jgi:hypothetical protein
MGAKVKFVKPKTEQGASGRRGREAEIALSENGHLIGGSATSSSCSRFGYNLLTVSDI